MDFSVGINSSASEPIRSEEDLNRVGNGNDDISSEEQFQNLKTNRGSYLGL